MSDLIFPKFRRFLLEGFPKGNFITSSEGLKNLFEKTYQDRLKHNEIKDDLKI